MANTLTGLIPTIHAGLAEVSRELIGFIPNVNRDAKAESGAVGQTVRSPVVPQGTLENITPGAAPASSGDQTIGFVDVTITSAKAYPIRWTGEEQKSLTKEGVINVILKDQFAQAFRTLANAVEVDLGLLYKKASRAYGTAGQTPFATAADMTDLAEANKILDDNGAPAVGRRLIVGSSARAKLEGKQSQLFKANEAGTDALLRNRQMRELSGFVMGYSAGVAAHILGAGASYDVDLNPGGYAAGDTVIHLDGGTVNTTGIKAGDVVTFAGDTNKYVVTTGTEAVEADITIGRPGLRLALADAVEMTIGGSYTANMFFHQNALLLAARTPAMPEGGDEADDVTVVMDPVSGLVFQIAVYRQYRQVKYEVGLAWGVQAINPEHAGILLG